MSKTYAYFTALIGTICVAFIFSMIFFPPARTVRSDLLQGFLIGFGMAFVTAQNYARIKAARVNGWITMFGLGDPGNGMMMRAACAQLFPNPDGSVDVYLQNTVPAGRDSNWLPAPSGRFILWLRVYEPGPAILDRTYQVPPVIKAGGQGA
ncbi:DUF1214 domain-containing protein [Arthrobacter liuii]|uniref:DUF1214 domain-containing protein n=1 Tax=Arthrobacter liuii TaxID=1476996 RepID=A0ABQ2AXB1_9MICC|nr:DUF1214 domain-containing protein [Arthrobacter liuii]GGI01030.1 hypothetical protein GCM10007170_39540 [Arthrobacter liuii]